MDKTTNLSIVRNKPSSFTWGKVIEIYEIAFYTIIEYLPEGKDYHLFHCYFDGKSLNTSSRTLDGALIICIAHANLGEVQYADWAPVAACKVLNIPEN